MNKQIDRMMYDNGNTTLYNFNRSVTKINEIIDVLNERTAPVIGNAEEERTLWVNEKCEVVEFCCEGLKGDFADYFDIKVNNFHIPPKYLIAQKRVRSERKMAVDSLPIYHCPYCGASIKCKTRVGLIIDAIRNIGVSYSEQDLKDVVEILKTK